MKIVIIGNSAAGTAAIETIRKHDTDSAITQLSDEAHPLYSRCLLSYYLSGTSDRKSLLFREADFHRNMAVDLKAGKQFRVESVEAANRKVFCAGGDSFEYDRLLIATGASAKLPELLSADMEGIYMLRNLDDADHIKKKVAQVKQAVVWGGGLIGIKAAGALAKLGIKTTIVIRSNRVLSQMIDFEASRIIAGQLEFNNIEIMHQTDIVEIESKDNRLTGIKTDRGDHLDCQLLIAAKGVSPNTQLVKETGIPIPWGIQTDEFMQTSDKQIYAAGDVAETYDIAQDTHTVNALWTCAIQQGRIAGLNIIGKEEAYDGTIGMNALNVYDTPIISFGISTPKDESQYRIHVLNHSDRKIYKKVVIGKDNRIKGIVLVGAIDNAGVLLSLIRRKIDVTPFEDELLSNRFNFGKLLKYGDASELERFYNRQIL